MDKVSNLNKLSKMITSAIPNCITKNIIIETYFNYLISIFYNINTNQINVKSFFIIAIILSIYLIYSFITYKTKVLIYDISCFEPPENLKFTIEGSYKQIIDGNLPASTLEFYKKIDTGIGPETAFSPGFIKKPFDNSIAMSREETELILFDVVEKLLTRNHLNPKDIDVLVVNCSLFCPTPSIASMIVKRFQMKSDILSYNLGGMGCSAGLISLDLAKRHIEANPNQIAIVCSTEILASHMYFGAEKEMLIQNMLFRIGGSGVLLASNSNKKRFTSKGIQVSHIERTYVNDDDYYSAVTQDVDKLNLPGVRITKSVMKAASAGLTKNITRIAPKILPYSEQLKYGLSYIGCKILNKKLTDVIMPKFVKDFLYACVDWIFNPVDRDSYILFPIKHFWHNSICFIFSIKSNEFITTEGSNSDLKSKSQFSVYQPNFEKGLDYFCIHAGGRGVLDAIEKNLGLSTRALLPARQTLYKYGNTSSSSIWYQLEYIRSNYELKSGQKIWQIGFGAGFKCNSALLIVQ